MELDLEQELANLKLLKIDPLREKYREICRETTHSRNRDYLCKRILWRMQANLYGGLSERAQERARELADTANLRLISPRSTKQVPTPVPVATLADKRLPKPGTILTRPYKGQNIQVKVLSDGFEYQGKKFLSLSAVAQAITGNHCNGYLFFKLPGAAK